MMRMFGEPASATGTDNRTLRTWHPPESQAPCISP